MLVVEHWSSLTRISARLWSTRGHTLFRCLFYLLYQEQVISKTEFGLHKVEFVHEMK